MQPDALLWESVLFWLIQCCAMNSKRLALLVPVVLCLLLCSSCTFWGEKKHASWRSATSGDHLVHLFWSDVKAKDWQNLEGHIGPAFTGISPAGTIDRAKLMEHLRSMELQDFQIGELESRMAGNDLIVTYTITATGTVGGRPLPSPVRMLSVWQELKHGWILVAHSTVPMS